MVLVLAREKRLARGQLGKHTAEGPHVDARRVAQAQYDLGGAVEARLDVRIDALVTEAAAAEIDDLCRQSISDARILRYATTMICT